MDRRSFLYATSTALGGLATLGVACATVVPRPAVPLRLGVQLYTVRDLLAEDVAGVLEAIQEIGYEEVEFAGYHGRPPREIRRMLDDLGLAAPAAHVSLDALRNNLDVQVEAAYVVGHDYLVVPWIDEAERSSLDGYRRVADAFNEIGARLEEAGIRLAYHNHAFEFESFGGHRSGYDVLLKQTDPALVVMEMDLYWIAHAGHDPVAYFKRYPGRFSLVHVKDRTPKGAMADVGAGAIDFERVFAHVEAAGMQHAFVEHDEPGDSLKSIRNSHTYLVRLRGA